MKKPTLPSRATLMFGVLILLHVSLSFLLPANSATKETYELNDAQYYALLLAVRLPIIAVWILLFYSYRWVKRYARTIQDTDEGPFFKRIATGVGVIAWGFLFISIITSILNGIANLHPSFNPTALIMGGYLYMLVPLIAFTYISSGVRSLSSYAKIQLDPKHIRILMLITATFSVVFCVLVSAKLQGTSLTNSYNSHYLPNGLVWTTLIIPYVYAAYLGILAVMELILIARRTPGVIYKRGLQLLAVGIILIVVMIVSLQYFRSIVPRTGSLTLGPTLMMTYGIYTLAAGGSLFLAAGAKRLKKIEEA